MVREGEDLGHCDHQQCHLTVPPQYQVPHQIYGLMLKTEFQTILGFNEPNEPGHGNMTAIEAAFKWIQLQEKFEKYFQF